MKSHSKARILFSTKRLLTKRFCVCCEVRSSTSVHDKNAIIAQHVFLRLVSYVSASVCVLAAVESVSSWAVVCSVVFFAAVAVSVSQ